MQTIDAAFLDCDLEELRSLSEMVRECVEITTSLENDVTNRVGAGNAPNFENLVDLLTRIDSYLTKNLTLRGAFEPSDESSGLIRLN